jgi:peptide/nickel transport system permease protein
MFAFVVRRLIQTVPLLLGITFLTFAIINLIPASPLTALELNPRVSPETVARIEENLGLNEPWPKRYVLWVGNLLRGDLGYSYVNGTPIADRILSVLPNTLLLSGTALVLTILLSIPLGIVAAVKQNSWFDYLTIFTSTAFFAVPTFWLGLLLIILFAVKFQEWGLPALPVGGMQDLRGGGGLLDRIEHMILPVAALTVVQLAAWTRYVRSSMLEVIRQDFVRTAAAKGLAERAIYLGHAFRNSLVTLATLIGLSIPELLGGSFLIESIFAWNGAGRLTVDAIRNNDYTLIMGIVLLFAVLTILGNLLADLLYAILDPRIRFD